MDSWNHSKTSQKNKRLKKHHDVLFYSQGTNIFKNRRISTKKKSKQTQIHSLTTHT